MKKIYPLFFGLLINFSAHAAAGVDTSGGAFKSANGTLLDFAEATDGTAKLPFDFKDDNACSGAYKVYSVLYHIEDLSLREPLLKGLSIKSWYSVKSLAGITPTEDISVLLDNKTKQPVAIQDSTKIVIDKKWYDSRSCDEKAAVILHEDLMLYALRWKIDHNNVREMVRALFADKLGGTFPSRDQLLRVTRENGFDVLMNVSKFEEDSARWYGYGDSPGYSEDVLSAIKNNRDYQKAFALLDRLESELRGIITSGHMNDISIDFLKLQRNSNILVQMDMRPAFLMIRELDVRISDMYWTKPLNYTIGAADYKKIAAIKAALYEKAVQSILPH